MRVERDRLGPVEEVLESPSVVSSGGLVGADDTVAALRREEELARGMLLRAAARVGRLLAPECADAPGLSAVVRAGVAVTVLSRQGCARCDAVVGWWARHGVEAEVVDVERHPALVAVMIAQGMRQVPVSVVRGDGVTWSSWLGRPAAGFLDSADEVWAGLDPERVRRWTGCRPSAPDDGGAR